MSHTNNMDNEGETILMDHNNENMMKVNNGEVSCNNNTAATAADKTNMSMQGLPYTAKKEDIAHFFQNCSTIKHINLPLDYDGQSSGSALVSFDSTVTPAASVVLHGEMFDEENERWVRIKYDTHGTPPIKDYQN
eukprot:15355687-Ditylum_brightwellii.AAC.1